MGKTLALLGMVVLVVGCKTSGGPRTSLSAPSLTAPGIDASLRELPLAVAASSTTSTKGEVFGCDPFVDRIRQAMGTALSEQVREAMEAAGFKSARPGEKAAADLSLDTTVHCFAADSFDPYKPRSQTVVHVAMDDGATFDLTVDVGPYRDVQYGEDGSDERFMRVLANRIVTALASHPRLNQIASARATPKAATASLAKDTKILVLPFRTVGQVAAHVPEQVMRLLMAQLDGIPRLSMMAGEDIEAMLDLERKKDLLGCDATSCMAEIGGALGAELVMQGQVGRLGQRYTINITIVNTKAASVLGRVSAMVEGTEDAIADQIPELANQIAAKLPSS